VPNVNIIGTGIDTLNLGFYGNVDPDLWAYLQERKAMGQGLDPQTGEILPGRSEEVPANVAGWTVTLKPHGSRHYSFVFYNADVRGQLAQRGRNPAPNLYIICNSDFLWRESAFGAYKIVQDFAFRLCNDEIERELASDVHIAVDFQGWEPPPSEAHRYVSRATKQDCHVQMHTTWQQHTGYTIGKGIILARLYDKRTEMTVHRKPYFAVVWEANPHYDPEAPVWRLEFQLRREAVSEFGIDTPAELFKRLNALWTYCAKDWLRYTDPSADKTRHRWPTAPVWRELAHARINDGRTPALRDRRSRARISDLLAMLWGLTASYAALHDTYGLHATLSGLREDLERMENVEGRDFQADVTKKLARMAEV